MGETSTLLKSNAVTPLLSWRACPRAVAPLALMRLPEVGWGKTTFVMQKVNVLRPITRCQNEKKRDSAFRRFLIPPAFDQTRWFHKKTVA